MSERARGDQGEAQAADFLLALGYTLVTRNYKASHGEIDLIALDGDILVFVEVRVRSGDERRPEESMSPTKVARLHHAAQAYVAAMGDRRDVRFDLVAIDDAGLRHHIGFC